MSALFENVAFFFANPVVISLAKKRLSWDFQVVTLTSQPRRVPNAERPLATRRTSTRVLAVMRIYKMKTEIMLKCDIFSTSNGEEAANELRDG